MTQTAATTFRVMYKCHNCKHVWALDYTVVAGKDFWGHAKGVRPVREGEHVAFFDGAAGDLISFQDDVMGSLCCPECGSNLPKYNRVEGHYSEKVKCGPRCTGAKGHVCDCQCGGKNHGANRL